VLFILLALWWAIYSNQFDDLEQESQRIIEND